MNMYFVTQFDASNAIGELIPSNGYHDGIVSETKSFGPFTELSSASTWASRTLGVARSDGILQWTIVEMKAV